MKRSQLFRDRLVKPLDEAMYWVKHVMKHKNTTHLKSAAVQLAWYEFYGVDVIIILLAVTFLTLLAMKLLIARILRTLRKKIRNMYSRASHILVIKDYKVD